MNLSLLNQILFPVSLIAGVIAYKVKVTPPARQKLLKDDGPDDLIIAD